MPPLAVLLLLAVQAPGQVPPDGQTHVITEPTWLRRPNPEDPAIWDTAPWFGGKRAAKVLIECRVNSLGDLGHCKVLQEEPVGFGLGIWAKNIAATFRARPRTVDGKPVSGGVIQIPFTLGEGVDPYR